MNINSFITNNKFGNKITDFTKIEEIGKGNFGTVLKMKSNIDGQIYAIKQINKKISKADLIHLYREIKIQNMLKHPNIIHLFGYFEDNHSIYLVFEFFEGINLKVFFQQKNYYLCENLIINIFEKILEGLVYLHGNNIIHRDITPDNILIDYNNNIIKIIDFGLSVIEGGNLILRFNCSKVGRKDFCCPEIINNQKYDFKCDIFSLGYTIYYLMNGQLPSKTIFNNDNDVMRKPLKPVNNNNYNKDLNKLVDQMYSYNPNDRPSAAQALKKLREIKNSLQYGSNFRISNISINDNSLISSFKCILQCIYGLDNLNEIKNIINNNINNNNNFLTSFVNMMDIVDKESKNQINITYYEYSIKLFLNEIINNKTIQSINRPIFLYYNIVSLFTKRFGNLIKWSNIISSELLSSLNDLPSNQFPDVYTNINNFKKQFRSPFVDIFYFLILIYIKCPKCDSTYYATSKCTSFLELINKEEDNLNNLIRNFLYSKTLNNNNINCKSCGYSGEGLEEKNFLSTPKYLVIDFYEDGKQINYEQKINLSCFMKKRKGLQEFEIYAVINKEIINNQTQYIASVKGKNGQWMFYSGDTKGICGTESLNVGTPSLAIYKRI